MTVGGKMRERRVQKEALGVRDLKNMIIHWHDSSFVMLEHRVNCVIAAGEEDLKMWRGNIYRRKVDYFSSLFLGFVRVTNCAASKISSECSRRTLAKEFYDCLGTCNFLITQMSLPMFQQILTNWFFDVVNRTFNSMLHFCHDMLTDNLNIEMNRAL